MRTLKNALWALAAIVAITTLAPLFYDIVLDQDISVMITKLGNLGYTTWVSAGGNVTFTGDLLPDTADSYDIGDPTAEWQDVYVGSTGKVYLGTDQARYIDATHPATRTATVTIASNTSPAWAKAQADYVCNGANDAAQINAAFAAAYTSGSFSVEFYSGAFFPATAITIPSSNNSYWQISGWGRMNTVICLPNLGANSAFTWDKLAVGHALPFFQISDLSFDGQNAAPAAAFVDLAATAEVSNPALLHNVEFRNIPYGTTALDVSYNEDIILDNVYNLGTGVARFYADTSEGAVYIRGGVMGEWYTTAQTFTVTDAIINGAIQWGPEMTANRLTISNSYFNVLNVAAIALAPVNGNVPVSGFATIENSLVHRNGTVYFAIATQTLTIRSLNNTYIDGGGMTAFQWQAGGGTAFVFTSTDDDFTAASFTPTGYLTKNSGTATVLNTTTSIVVNHGLATTPTRVQITPTENPTNAVSFWWVDTLTATQFTIHVNADPGASNLDFNWRAVIGEGN